MSNPEMIHLFVSGTTGGKELSLTRRQAIDLELALNKSQYGHSWKHIGDILFNFGGYSNMAVNSYGVSEFQFLFLEQLCKDAKIFF